jgi:hypothetical protein
MKHTHHLSNLFTLKYNLIFFMFSIAVTPTQLLGQASQFGLRISIPEYADVIKNQKIKDCQVTIEKQTVVKKEFIIKKSDTTFTCTTTEINEKPKTILIDKNKQFEVKPFEGLATLTPDKNEPSIIHINYFLETSKTIPIGKKIDVIDRRFKCNEIQDTVTHIKSTKDEQTNRMYYVNAEKYEREKEYPYIKMSNQIIVVYEEKDPNKIDYCLIDVSGDYELHLQNRVPISFPSRSFDVGPVIIPFKYHFGYGKADPEISSNLNIGLLAGPSLGRYRVRLDNKDLKLLTGLKITPGLFVNFSTTALDSLSTNEGKNPFSKDKKTTIGIFSYGIACVANFYNVQFGIFGGLDTGMGKYASSWNFNNKFWFGFGFGFSISDLLKNSF